MKRLSLFLLYSFPFVSMAQSEVFFNLPVAEKMAFRHGSQELTLIQNGQLNQIQYREVGSNNRVNIQQKGVENAIDLAVLGTNNQYSVSQDGNRNRMEWGAFQQNNNQLDVSQRGNNNQLIREGSSTATGVPMRIEQTGGIQLLIRNGF